MNFRTFTAIAFTTLLAACGAGQPDIAAPTQLASNVTSVPADAPASAPATAPATNPAVAAAAESPNMPLPDCAAEGCASLRIIDGNAEAYRLDAMRRATAATQS